MAQNGGFYSFDARIKILTEVLCSSIPIDWSKKKQYLSIDLKKKYLSIDLKKRLPRPLKRPQIAKPCDAHNLLEQKFCIFLINTYRLT